MTPEQLLAQILRAEARHEVSFHSAEAQGLLREARRLLAKPCPVCMGLGVVADSTCSGCGGRGERV